MHLAVDMSEDSKMTMLYKIDEGFVREEHYGLALARVVDLPTEVLEVANNVAQVLEAQAIAKKNSSKAFAVFKRRKLVLSLRDTLKQAESSNMADDVLLSWLRKLQEEFVRRMEKIDNDVASSDSDETADEEEDEPEADEQPEGRATSVQE